MVTDITPVRISERTFEAVGITSIILFSVQNFFAEIPSVVTLSVESITYSGAVDILYIVNAISPTLTIRETNTEPRIIVENPKPFIFIKMHAVIHTKGVVLGDEYVPLELAYRDVAGLLCHFQITSPMNFSKMRRLYPNCRPDVEVTTVSGTSYSDTLKFLKNRYDFLQTVYPHTPVVFGYKGELFQPKILIDASIPNIVNVETFGVPPLKRNLNIECFCPLHKGDPNKCALVALNQIVSHFL